MFKYIKSLLAIFIFCFALINPSLVFAVSPSGQGLFIVNSTSDITNPVNGQTWAFLPGPPAQLWAYYSNTWNMLCPTQTGDVTTSACTVTVKGVQNVPFAISNVTSTGALTLNMASSLNFNITLTAGTTLTCSSPVDQNSYVISLLQDSSGNHTVTPCTNMDFGSTGNPTVTTTANKSDVWVCKYYASSAKFKCGVIGTGYSF